MMSHVKSFVSFKVRAKHLSVFRSPPRMLSRNLCYLYHTNSFIPCNRKLLAVQIQHVNMFLSIFLTLVIALHVPYFSRAQAPAPPGATPAPSLTALQNQVNQLNSQVQALSQNMRECFSSLLI